MGATISYTTVEALTVNGIGGTNTSRLNGSSIPTYLNGGAGSGHLHHQQQQRAAGPRRRGGR